MESFHVAFDQQQKAKKNKIIWSLLLTLWVHSKVWSELPDLPALAHTDACTTHLQLLSKDSVPGILHVPAPQIHKDNVPIPILLMRSLRFLKEITRPTWCSLWVASLKFKPVLSNSRYYTQEKPEKLDVFSSKVYIWNWNIWSVTSEWILYTLDPWTTRVWTVQVHLYTGFFFSYTHICSSMQSAISWIPRCRIMDMEANGKIMWFLSTWKVARPNPHVIAIVFQKSGWFVGCDYLKTSTS